MYIHTYTHLQIHSYKTVNIYSYTRLYTRKIRSYKHCAYISMQIYLCTQKYTRINITHTYTCTNTLVYNCAYIFTYTHLYKYIRINAVCISPCRCLFTDINTLVSTMCTQICVCICTSIDTYKYTRIKLCIYIHIPASIYVNYIRINTLSISP